MERYESLDEDNLPVLEVRRLTDEDVERMREEQRELDEAIGDGGELSYPHIEEEEDLDNDIVEISDDEGV